MNKRKPPILGGFLLFGRNEVIRTPDLLVPNQAHYQAVLHPELALFSGDYYSISPFACQ